MIFPKQGGNRKGSKNCGRRGMPKEWVAAMYADYLALNSLALTGELHGRSRQSMFDLFKSHRLPMRARSFHDQWSYGGRKYTPGKNDYLRDTIYRKHKAGFETHLHRRIWADNFGPIPPGHNVTFKDGNKRNFALDNLLCGPIQKISAMTATGSNQFTKTAGVRLKVLLRGSDAAALKRRAA